MARRKRAKAKTKAKAKPAEAADESVDLPSDLSDDTRGVSVLRVGQGAMLLGSVGVVVERASLIGAISAGLVFLGALLFVAGRMWRDRRRRAAHVACPKSPGSLPLGIALLGTGFSGLLLPAFVSIETYRGLVAQYPYGPLVAVCLMGSGAAFAIDHFDRPAPSEPPFGVPDPPGILKKLILLNPLQIPLWVPAAFSPSLRKYAPFPWWLYDTWVELDREAGHEREARVAASKSGYDWRPITVFLTGSLFLTLMEYFGHAPTLHELVSEYADGDNLWGLLQASPFYHGSPNRGVGSGLIEFVWWSGWRLLGFFLLPALVLRLLGEKVADHGLQIRGFLGHAWYYVIFFGIVLIAVVVVSYDDHFQTYYPFYDNASRSWYDFWSWEALYAVQFFSLEFFFRGYWIKAGKSMMGSHVIYAMVVPYVMIHFGKPFLETIAATLAGLVLGTLALRTRSIWAGFLIHVTVAISMDLAALSQTTGLPERWWPAL